MKIVVYILFLIFLLTQSSEPGFAATNCNRTGAYVFAGTDSEKTAIHILYSPLDGDVIENVNLDIERKYLDGDDEDDDDGNDNPRSKDRVLIACHLNSPNHSSSYYTSFSSSLFSINSTIEQRYIIFRSIRV